MSAIAAVTRFSFLRRAAGFRLLGPAVVTLLPAVMMAVILIDSSIDSFELYRAFIVPVMLYFALPLVCMFVMLPILSELYDKGAIGYLFTRPAPRWKTLLGLFLGGFLATLPVFLIGVAVSLLLGILAGNDTPFVEWLSLGAGVLGVLVLASLANGAICLFIGVKTKRPIIWAFVALVGFGSVLGSLPGSGQQFSLHYYLISLAYRWCGITASKSDLFAPLETIATVPVCLTALIGVTAAMLFATSWAARQRDIL